MEPSFDSAASPIVLVAWPVERLAVCRLPPEASLPAWALAGGEFVSITRTSDELSIVCAEARVPPGVEAESGFRVLKVQGPLAFEATGIIARLATCLATAGISVLAVATYETDYLLVKADRLEAALAALRAGGHTVESWQSAADNR
jgi:hypothetical protein